MEAAIRFSRNAVPGAGHQQFLKVDVANKSFKLCKITKESRKQVQYDTIASCNKVPAFRAFDWHPTDETLVATGGSVGDATLLRIAEGQQDSWAFSTRNQRACNAVAISAENLLAVGLDRVRTDFCLNIWDLTQHVSSTSSRSLAKSYSDPLHKLAGGEAITSLKFYNGNPQLLVAGVKGQYVRLYDLRKPNNSPGLQFATKCVSNLAIDNLDENYFASCYPLNEPYVCVWDRRMANHIPSNHPGYAQSTFPSEVSLELPDVTYGSGAVWSLRFSKSKRGCLGVLTSAGHLKVFEIGKDFMSNEYEATDEVSYDHDNLQRPEDIYLRGMQDIEQPTQVSPSTDVKERAVTFDFMTGSTRTGQPKMIVLTGEDVIRVKAMQAVPEPSAISATDFVCKGSSFVHAPMINGHDPDVATRVNKIRRTAESKNSLKQAYKTSKHARGAPKERLPDLRRMSSFANHSWNTDLGFYEKNVVTDDLLILLAAPRLRCESGYLLEPAKNRSIAADSQWTEAFWSWLERAERISKNQGMVQDNLDLSFVGAYSIWMEEIVTSPRQTGASFSPMSAVIKNIVARLHLPQLKGVRTEYPWYRKLCLYISGIAWSTDEVDSIVQKLSASNQHTKAAATAIFADEEKLAYKALRSPTATQSHKMLAMAIAGARRRKSKIESGPNSRSPSDSETDDDDDWVQTISSLSTDLNDPYARAILTYVKSGNWTDVVNEEALPLKQRLGVALRHLSDADLTTFIGRTTRQVISAGDIEGIILTGTGTREGLELLQAYASKFNDLQTAVLGMSVGGAARKFMGNAPEDVSYVRRLEAMREAYRSTIMSWGLKFHRVHFDISYARALNGPMQYPSSASPTPPRGIPRPKEQIKLVCAYCTQSLTQFPVEDGLEAGQLTKHTAKNPLTSDKAAVVGTVCPKCGRHLPRCGVCDLWLGVPDETFSRHSHANTTDANISDNSLARSGTGKASNGANKRHLSSGANSTDAHMMASMTASVVTTIGPQTSSSTASASKAGPNRPGQMGRSLSTQSTGSRRDQVLREEDGHEDKLAQAEREKLASEKKWAQVMHKFTVFCVRCSHGFHAEHAQLWFQGTGVQQGHRVCPVPTCGCTCNG